MLSWWDAGHRDLPWRFPQHAADPYRVWLAEVMLQQTRVATAEPYYRRFVARWPTLPALAAADDGEVLAAWSVLGYYARCRNLLAAAREALARHGGLPASLPDLRALPGFGPYTAGAVASVAFAIPAAAVDGNAMRVLSRLEGVTGSVMSLTVKRRIEAIAGALVPAGRPGDWNQAVMELGATVCLPRRPRCAECPIVRACVASREGLTDRIPARRERRAPERRVMALARIERGGRLLMLRAPPRGLFAGMWGFPWVNVPAGADPGEHLRRRAAPELGVRLEVGREIATVTRLLTHRRLELVVHACRLRGKPPQDLSRWAFTSEGEASRLPASTAMRRVIEASGGWTTAPRGTEGTEKRPGSTGRP